MIVPHNLKEKNKRERMRKNKGEKGPKKKKPEQMNHRIKNPGNLDMEHGDHA